MRGYSRKGDALEDGFTANTGAALSIKGILHPRHREGIYGIKGDRVN